MRMKMERPPRPERPIANEPEREQGYLLARDGLSLSQIAQMLNVARGTVGRWSAEDGWQQRLEEERASNRIRMAYQLQGFLVTEVVASLHHVRDLRDSAKNETVQLAAAKFLIELPSRLDHMLSDLERITNMDVSVNADGSISGAPLSFVHAIEDAETISDDELEERQRARVTA